MTSFNEVTGVLDRTQFPDALLLDGSRQLTDDLLVAPGVKVDGIDISAFNSLYQYHLGDPLAHGYVTNILDDSSQAVERNPLTNAVRIYGSDGIVVTQTEYGLRVSGSGIGGGGSGFGIKDNIGSGAVPDGLGYITFTSDSSMTILSAGNGVSLAVVPGNISHQSLGGRSKNDHHTAFTGLSVGGSIVSPDASDRISLVAGTNVSLSVLPSTVTVNISSTPIFTGLTVNGNLSITGTVDGVDVSVLNTDVADIDLALDTLSTNFSSHVAATSVHGATGAVVGTTNTQSLTNKTLVSPTFAPATATAPFVLSANGQSQTVVGLRADQLNKSVTAGNGLTGGGALTGNISLAVGQGTGISVAATTVGVDTAHPFAWTADHTWSGKIGFGSVTRQMIDLYGTVYGIGVQGSTAYIRTNKRFSVHLSGTHSNTENEPGSGGTVLFTVTTSLIEYKGSTIWHAANDGTGSGLDADLWDGYQFSDYLNQAVKSTSSPTFAALTVNGLITATSTGENMRLRYDANNYASFTVGTGSLTLKVLGSGDAVGDLLLDAGDVSPTSGYYTNLGSPTKKYLTLHAAELWVDTLVSQEKITTIGGRVIVGQSSSLTRDIDTSATTLYLKHNNFRSGDIAYMETRGQIEFIKINSNPTTVTEEAEYSYTVVRNQDGTGAGAWYAGDSIFNTGTTGNGWIDMYSLWSMSGRPLSAIFNYNHNGAKFSTNYAQNASWSLFGDGANNQTSDSVFFGLTGTTWSNLYFNIVTAGVYSATVTWQYWNGTAWVSFTPTVSAGTATAPFKNEGSYSVTWGALSGWSTTSVNGLTAYWIRSNITAFTSWTTLPVQGDRKVRAVEKQYGPTIVGNVRTGTTWNLWEERWAVGNLDGIYGYGVDTYGAAFGDPDATNITIDDSNGIRIRNGANTIASWNTSGNIVLGNTGFEHITISTTTIQIKDGDNVYTSLTSGALSLGLVSTGDYLTIDGTNGVRIYNNATVSAHWKADGNLVIGEIANSKSRIEITSGAINIINRSAGGADTTAISLSNNGSASFTGTITASAGSITGALTLGASGGIYQGTGTFASPTTGLKIWSESSVGRIAGYNASVAQWYAGTDGKLYAGAGNVILDENGLTLVSNTSDLFDSKKAIAWSHSSANFFTMDGRRVTSPAQTIGDIAVTETTSSRSALLRIRAIGGAVSGNEPVVSISASRSYKHATLSLTNTASGPTSSIGVSGDTISSLAVTESSVTVSIATVVCALFGTQGTILNGYVRGNQAGNSLRIDTGTGYIDIGARNTAWAHFYTDRPGFYLDVPVHVNGAVSSYNTDFNLQRAGSTKLSLTGTGVIVTGTLTGSTSLDADTLYGGTSYAGLSGISNLGNSIYVQSASNQHLVSVFSDGYSHISAIAFGAYPVTPKPTNNSYHFAGNMRYLGGDYLSQTQAGMFSFAGNGGKYFWLTSAGGLANHAGITWTEIMSVTASALTVMGSIIAPSITLTANSYTSARFVATAVSTSGSVGLVPGTANDPGYIEWHRKNGTTRIGYMGWSTGGENNLAIVLENSAQLRVIGGNMGINADPGSYRLRVNGNSYFEGDNTVTGILNVTGTLIVPNGGTVSTPSIYFDTDTNTGFYRWASDSWSLVAGGVSLIAMTPTSIDLKEELGNWIALPFATGWSNHGSSWNVAQYKKVGDLVFLRGMVTASSWSATPTIATLPLNFRPLSTAMFVCMANANSPIRVDVNTDGTIRWNSGGAGTLWISLNNIVISTK